MTGVGPISIESFFSQIFVIHHLKYGIKKGSTHKPVDASLEMGLQSVQPPASMYEIAGRNSLGEFLSYYFNCLPLELWTQVLVTLQLSAPMSSHFGYHRI